MKPTAFISALLLLLFLASFGAEAQSRKKTKTRHKTTVPKKTVHGAASVEELGQYVYAALQNNNFEAITHYFPTEEDMASTEKRTPNEDLQLVLEGQTPATLQAGFHRDFDQLQKKTIDQKVSFRDLKLMEVHAGTPKKANRVIPVNMLLSNQTNETVTIAFEALKINGRYFLFQNIAHTDEPAH